jgi:ribosomal protein L11 methyltransferase
VTQFLELSFALGELDAQAAEAACFEAGASAVTFADGADDPVLEPLPGEVRLWRDTILTALFAQPAAPAALARALADALKVPPQRIGARHLEDRAWEREWLRDFHAMRFGGRLWVCPHHEQVGEPQAVVVKLDPGLAFGTGTHASTALCLTWLDAHLVPGARVIDYGCGSGILAVAAVLLGASEVHAFDIDPQALTATAENAAANDVGSRVQVHALAATLPATTDVLLANILAGTLCTLAPQFAQVVAAGGAVVLAGILEPQVPEVTAAYTPWFDVSRFGARDGWAALSGRRR